MSFKIKINRKKVVALFIIAGVGLGLFVPLPFLNNWQYNQYMTNLTISIFTNNYMGTVVNLLGLLNTLNLRVGIVELTNRLQDALLSTHTTQISDLYLQLATLSTNTTIHIDDLYLQLAVLTTYVTTQISDLYLQIATLLTYITALQNWVNEHEPLISPYNYIIYKVEDTYVVKSSLNNTVVLRTDTLSEIFGNITEAGAFYLIPSFYNVTSEPTIYLNSNQFLISDGAILHYYNPDRYLFNFRNVENCTVEGITICIFSKGIYIHDCNNIRFSKIVLDRIYLGQSYWVDGFNIENSNSCIIEGCKFKNFKNQQYSSAGLLITNCSNILISGNTFEYTYKAIVLMGCSNILISDNLIDNCYRGVEVFTLPPPSNNCLIMGNMFKNIIDGSSPYAVVFQPGNQANNSVIGNTFYNCKGYISDLCSYDGTFRNNFHDGNPRFLGTPTVTTQIIYNTYGTQVSVMISFWRDSELRIYRDEIWVYTLYHTADICYLTLQAGESLRVSSSDGVTWQWFSDG